MPTQRITNDCDCCPVPCFPVQSSSAPAPRKKDKYSNEQEEGDKGINHRGGREGRNVRLARVCQQLFAKTQKAYIFCVTRTSHPWTPNTQLGRAISLSSAICSFDSDAHLDVGVAVFRSPLQQFGRRENWSYFEEDERRSSPRLSGRVQDAVSQDGFFALARMCVIHKTLAGSSEVLVLHSISVARQSTA